MKTKRLILSIIFALFFITAQAATIVRLGPEYFPDPTRGRPISSGSLYVGIIDLDPEIIANQKQLSILQENGTTIEVPQPITTGAGGIPLYNGSPVTVLVDGSYSLKLLDSSESQVYYVPKNAIIDSLSSIENISDLRLITEEPENGDVIPILGYYSPGDGGGGAFYWSSSSVLSDNGGTIIKVTSITTGRWLRLYDGYNIKSIWFGTVGNDSASSTIDTAALQNSIDNTPDYGTLDIGNGFTYSLEKTTGSVDDYGLKINRSNMTLTGRSIIKREDSIVSSGYFPLFIGVPDSTTLGDRVENIVIDGVYFVGDDTRHTSDGDASDDSRYTIGTKNFRNLEIKNCIFTEVDSGVVYSYGTYPSASYYLLQKSYELNIHNNRFIGSEHAVAKRAIIHCIATRGVDDVTVDDNYFAWIDDCFSPFGTFQDPGQLETDTFVYSGENLKRAGKNAFFTNNIVYNTSEHSVYFIQPGFVASDNIIYTDTPTICNGDIKTIYGYGTIADNMMTVGAVGMSIMILARDITISGNAINVASNGDDAVSHMGINIDAQSLTAAYIAALPFLSEDIQKNIILNSNVITMPDVIASLDLVIGIRVVTAASQTLTAPYSIDGVEIQRNTISNYRYGVYYINTLINNIDVKNNSFIARDFVTAGFNGATVMNTYAPLVIFHSSNMGDRTTFSGNRVFGAEYMFASDDGSGSGLNLPTDCSQNKLDYIQNQFTSDLDAPSFYNNFKMNTGIYYLDRTWSGHQTENSLSAVGLGDVSSRRSCFFYDGTNMRWYTDDAGTFISF